MAVLYANNATTTLAASITNSATSLSVAAGKGALFPAIGGSDYFYVTLTNTAGAIEIVKVTARSVDTFTVTRGQDGTTGLAWAAGDKVDLRITKAVLDDLKTDAKASLSSTNVTTALGYTPYNATNPSGYITGITSGMVTTALGYTPLSNATSYLPLGGGTLTGNVSNTGGMTAWNATTPGTGVGNYHIGTSSSTANTGGAITFGARDASSGTNAQAGIYITSDGSYGTRMYLATTDSYVTGARNAVSISESGVVNVLRGALQQGGNQVLHAGNYTSYSPSLTGSGASGTWGINITGSAASITGTYGGTLTSSQVTTALGYTPYNSTNPSGYITASASITGYAYGLNTLDTDRALGNRLPTSTGQSVRFDFANASALGTGGNYGGVMTFSPYTGTTSSTGDASYQLGFGSTATNGSGTPRLRIRNGIDSTWNAWYDLYTGANYSATAGWTPIVSGGVTRTSQTTWAKTGGSNNVWDGQVYSAEAYPTNVYCQASFPNTTSSNTFFGLNTLDGTTDTDPGFAVIDFTWYGTNGTLQIYESGNLIASYGTYTGSTVCTITYDGSNIRYYKDGALQRTVARATGNGLYFDSSFYNNSSGSQLSNVEFGRLSQYAIRQDNIGSFAPSLTGSGASGTWGISISGNAATATSATDSTKLSLTGGTLSGNLVLSSGYIDLGSHLYQRADTQVLNSAGNAWVRIIARNSGSPYLENITYGGNTILHAGNYTSYAAQGIGNTGTSDLNTITVSGMYRVNNTEANRPGDYGQLLVIHGASDTITQIYGQYNTGTLYTRSGNPSNVGGSGSWTAWRTVLDSSNYTSYVPGASGGTYTGTNTVSLAATGDSWNSTLTSTTLTDVIRERYTKTNTPAAGIQTNNIGGLAWNGKNYLGNSYEWATITGSITTASSLSSGAYGIGVIDLTAMYYSGALAVSSKLRISNGAVTFYTTGDNQYLNIAAGGIVPTSTYTPSVGSNTNPMGDGFFRQVRANNGWFENTKLLQASQTLATGFNAFMAGPVTVDTGYTITISDGSTLTIV
jgi:hypothetical protein